MHTWKHQEKNLTRYGATFELPDAFLCWLRGHRARVEVRAPQFSEAWVLVECRVCGLRYSNPAAVSLKLDSTEEQKRHSRDRVAFARRAPAELARNCSERDGYGHRRVTVTMTIHPRTHWRPGFELRIGDRWSETPFDAVVHTWRRSIYFDIGGVGNLLAQRITKGSKKKIRVGAKFIENAPSRGRS